MRRAFDLDVLACPRCGGRLRLIATVEDPEAILAALAVSRDGDGRAPPGRGRAGPGSHSRGGARRLSGIPDAAVAEVCSLAFERGASL